MPHQPPGLAQGAGSVSAPAREARAPGAARQPDSAVDPSIHFIVEPPRRPARFQGWFTLAIFIGILMALALVAITT